MTFIILKALQIFPKTDPFVLQVQSKSNEVHLFDPHLINSKVYNLVMRKNHKSCPSQVTMCEQFRVAFQTCDSFVVKTTGECQHDKRMEN